MNQNISIHAAAVHPGAADDRSDLILTMAPETYLCGALASSEQSTEYASSDMPRIMLDKPPLWWRTTKPMLDRR